MTTLTMNKEPATMLLDVDDRGGTLVSDPPETGYLRLEAELREAARAERKARQARELNKRTWVRRVAAVVMTMLVSLGVTTGAFGNKPREAEAITSQIIGAIGPELLGMLCPDKEGSNLVDCVIDLVGSVGVIEQCLAGPSEDILSCFMNAADKKSGLEDDETKNKVEDYSMYRMGSAMASFYSNEMAPAAAATEGGAEPIEGPTGLGVWQEVLSDPANGGIVLAFPDATHLENNNWLFTGDAINEANYSYLSLAGNLPSSVGPANDNGGLGNIGGALGGSNVSGPYGYSLFGATLSGLGLDSTIPRNPQNASTKSLMGGAIMLAYVASGAIDTLFNFVIGLLQTLNPFRLLLDPVTRHTDANFTAGMSGGLGVEDTPFEGLSEFFGQIYDGVIQLSWLVTIPLFMGTTVMGMLMFRRFDRGGALKKLAVRLTFLVVGVPLLGVTYTGALDSMSGYKTESSGANATKVVLSTYVDFESWASNTRLKLPDKTDNKWAAVWDETENGPAEESLAAVRKTTLAINASSNPMWKNFQQGNNIDTSGGGWMQSSLEQGRSYDGQQGTGYSAEDASQIFMETIGLLNRFINQDQVSSSGYESSVKTTLTSIANGSPEAGGEVLGWVTGFSDARAVAGMDSDALAQANNPILSVAPGTGLTASRTSDGSGGGRVVFDSSQAGVCDSMHVVGEGGGQVTDDPLGFLVGLINGFLPGQGAANLSNCNLSPLSFYNYLNTSFDTTTGTVYSSGTSVGGNTRELHASVNAVGSGFMVGVYWFSAMSLLVSFVIIGVIYAMSMLFNTFKRGVQLITAVPFATLGLMAGISKTIVYTITMFLEVLGTLFLYRMVQELLIALPALIEEPLSRIASGEGASEAGAILGVGVVGTALTAGHSLIGILLVTLVTSIAVIIFTMIAIKLRGSLIGAVDEASTRMVNKLLDTEVSSGADGGGGGALRQGIARGAGMGVAHRMMSQGGDDGGDTGDDGGGDHDGPDGDGGGGGGAHRGDGVAAEGGGAFRNAAFGSAGGLMTAAAASRSGIEDMASASSAEYSEDLAEGPGAGSDGFQYASASSEQMVDGGGLPADDYSFDENGALTTSDGETVTDNNGAALTRGDVAQMTSDGHLAGADGAPIQGTDGSSFHGSEVAGVDPQGNLVGADGMPLTDAQGEPIKAEGAALQGGSGASDRDLANAGGVAAGAGAGALAGNLMSDRELADKVAAQGGLTDPGELEGAAGASGLGQGESAGTAGLTTAGTAGSDSEASTNYGGVAGADSATGEMVASTAGGSELGSQAGSGGYSDGVATDENSVEGDSAPKALGQLASTGVSEGGQIDAGGYSGAAGAAAGVAAGAGLAAAHFQQASTDGSEIAADAAQGGETEQTPAYGQTDQVGFGDIMRPGEAQNDAKGVAGQVQGDAFTALSTGGTSSQAADSTVGQVAQGLGALRSGVTGGVEQALGNFSDQGWETRGDIVAGTAAQMQDKLTSGENVSPVAADAVNRAGDQVQSAVSASGWGEQTIAGAVGGLGAGAFGSALLGGGQAAGEASSVAGASQVGHLPSGSDTQMPYAQAPGVVSQDKSGVSSPNFQQAGQSQPLEQGSPVAGQSQTQRPSSAQVIGASVVGGMVANTLSGQRGGSGPVTSTIRESSRLQSGRGKGSGGTGGSGGAGSQMMGAAASNVARQAAAGPRAGGAGSGSMMTGMLAGQAAAPTTVTPSAPGVPTPGAVGAPGGVARPVSHEVGRDSTRDRDRDRSRDRDRDRDRDEVTDREREGAGRRRDPVQEGPDHRAPGDRGGRSMRSPGTSGPQGRNLGGVAGPGDDVIST